ncbi:hypothetical protein FACS18942_02240 [Planctomycetales bacterium]|nr:hypothetical protein FACS18942_02240 [Planctomycetales bacterium]
MIPRDITPVTQFTSQGLQIGSQGLQTGSHGWHAFGSQGLQAEGLHGCTPEPEVRYTFSAFCVFLELGKSEPERHQLVAPSKEQPVNIETVKATAKQTSIFFIVFSNSDRGTAYNRLGSVSKPR